jgi:hypothetical protein
MLLFLARILEREAGEGWAYLRSHGIEIARGWTVPVPVEYFLGMVGCGFLTGYIQYKYRYT